MATPMATPRKRRSPGEGTIYQRKSDGLWVGTFEAGYTRTGTRRRVPVYGKTRAVVARKLRDKMREVAEVGAVGLVAERATIASYAPGWLEQTKTTLRPKAWRNNQTAVKRWIIPTIGHRRLNQLTPADVRAVSNAVRSAGLTSTTARCYHWSLISMLKAAMLDGAAVPQRVLLVEAPAPAPNDREAMPIAEALAVLEVASFLPHGSRWAAALLHGIRQGECLGMTRDCLDFENDLIIVKWQLQRLPYLDPKDKKRGFQKPDGLKVKHLVDAFHLVEVKSRKGERVHPMLPAMKTALQDWLEVAPPNKWGLVWPNAKGRPANLGDDEEEWYALQGAAMTPGHPAGRYYYLHEARHLTATQLMELGVDEHVITALLGHSSIVISQGYMHVNGPARRQALEGVAARLQLGAKP